MRRRWRRRPGSGRHATGTCSLAPGTWSTELEYAWAGSRRLDLRKAPR
ncbi:hypothetical protein JOF53_008559 [Crossiella equi]|uniref:Uncharacterized protein n=1 Tax=Crossiella equi TaxID=130796 RepID=A0ABS5ATU9_9PSEU|nr:hypothetical protein [Crossiella equi]